MKNCRTKYALKYRIGGWIGLLIFVPPFFLLWTAHPVIAIGIFGFFILLSIYNLIEGNGTLEITPEMIIAHRLYGRYGIRWDEIETIRYCVNGNLVTSETMVLEGSYRRLNIYGPSEWAGAGGAESRRWFLEEV